MSQQSPGANGPSVLHMAAPLVVSFVMRAAFTLVDTIYAATLGDSAVAAIGIAVPFEFAMIAAWVGLSTGLTSCFSRAVGAGEGRKIEQYMRSGWILVGVISPVFLLLGIWIWFLFPPGALAEDVLDSFRIYGAVIISGFAFTTFWSVIPDSVVKAHHDTRSIMWAGIISNVLNVTLNTLFLFVFHWGMFGIAFSTVLGRIGGLAFAMHRARRHEERRKAAGTDGGTELDPSPYRSILFLAIPSSLGFLLMASEVAVVNLLLSFQEHSTEVLAAYSIYYRVALFALNPIIAAAVALLPYTARRFGVGDFDGVRRGLRETLVACGVYSLGIVAPVTFFGAGWIASHLGESPLTVTSTAFALMLSPLACLLGAPFLLCRSVFEGMNRGRPGLVVAILRYVILTVPLAWIGFLWARSLELPGFYGLLVGLLVAAGLSSGVLLVWVGRSLRSLSETVGQPATGS